MKQEHTFPDLRAARAIAMKSKTERASFISAVVLLLLGLVADITCRVGLMWSLKRKPPFMGEIPDTSGDT